jgi:hypothetical protein
MNITVTVDVAMVTRPALPSVGDVIVGISS